MFSVSQTERKVTGSGLPRSPQSQKLLTRRPNMYSASSLGGSARSQSVTAQPQSDWERQVESLDQKEMELHQTQMKLIREQMTNLVGELSGVKDELSDMRLKRETDAVQAQVLNEELHRDRQEMQSEMLALIEALQEDHRGHSTKLNEATSKLESMHARLPAVERFGGSLEELRRAHGNNHSLLKDRLDSMDKLFGETFDKHGKHLQTIGLAHDRHLSDFAKHAKDMDALKAEKQANHRGLLERLDSIERSHGEANDRHSSKASDLHAKCQSALDRVAGIEKRGEHIGNLQRSHDSLATRKAELESSHASMEERVGYLEKMLGDSVEKHAKELRALRDSHSKHTNDMDGLRGLHAKHGTVDERLDYLEKMLGDSVEKHAKELRALRDSHSKHTNDMDGLRGLHTKHSTVDERLDYLEGCIGDSADKHSEELANLKQSHDGLHGRLAAFESHSNVLAELRKSHSSLASQKAQLETHHATLKERVDYLERILNDSADKHTKALAEAHTKLSEMHGRLASCERFGPSLSELKKGHSDLHDHRNTLDSEHASVKDRLDNMEALFGDSANRQTKELKALKASHDKHAAVIAKHASQMDVFSSHREEHASVPERLEYLEQQFGDSADKHLAEVADLHKKIAKEQAAREKHHGSVKEMLAREQEERGNHHASLNERVDYIESVIGDNADKHARELAQVASSHQKLSGELKSRGENHGAIADRISKLEKVVCETSEKLERDARATKTKFQSFSGRLSAVQEAWSQATPRP